MHRTLLALLCLCPVAALAQVVDQTPPPDVLLPPAASAEAAPTETIALAIQDVVSDTPNLALETNAQGEEIMVMLSDVLFSFGEAAIRPEAEATLSAVAEVLSGMEGVVIEGHTDVIGPADFNLILSVQRAEAVRDWLVTAGVPETTLEVVGRGETQPLTPERLPEGITRREELSLNRRVEFVLP